MKQLKLDYDNFLKNRIDVICDGDMHSSMREFSIEMMQLMNEIVEYDNDFNASERIV